MTPAPGLSLEDLAFLSLVGWCGYVDPSWVAYPHLVLLCRELEDLAHAVARGETRRLMVFMPPQHGKSRVTSRGFPTWLLGRWPHFRLILASYESSYASQWGRYARDVLTEHGERVFGVKVSQGSSAADHWELAKPHSGVFHSGGMAAGITGQPCEICVIDDPVKNRDDAESPVIRQKIIDTYTSVILTRRPKGIVLVMTRWHEQDPAGWILEHEKHMPWRIVRLPALAEVDDPLGREVGAPLCPELQSLQSLLETKQTQPSYEWAGMYEQRPTPVGGGLFKRDAGQRYTLRDGVYADGTTLWTLESMRTFVTVDTATSEKTSADQTAIAAWGVTQDRRLVMLDLDLARIEGPEIMRRIVLMGKKWKTIAYVEENSTSKHLLSFMRSQEVVFRVVKPGTTDKFTRALPASGIWEQKKLLLPDQADWLSAFERQFFLFTGKDGNEDDAVDATSYAARVFLEEFGCAEIKAPPPRKDLPDELGGLAIRGAAPTLSLGAPRNLDDEFEGGWRR